MAKTACAKPSQSLLVNKEFANWKSLMKIGESTDSMRMFKQYCSQRAASNTPYGGEKLAKNAWSILDSLRRKRFLAGACRYSHTKRLSWTSFYPYEIIPLTWFKIARWKFPNKTLWTSIVCSVKKKSKNELHDACTREQSTRISLGHGIRISPVRCMKKDPTIHLGLH